MSAPTEIEFALVKVGDGAQPTENFTVLCGLRDVTVNRTVNTTDRTTYDCDKPNAPGIRKVRVNGKQMDITGSGLTNAAQIPLVEATLGRHKNYEIDCYADDGTDAGELLGQYKANFVMTAANMNLTKEGAGSAETTLASDGEWDWIPA
jgi:hypothetical protein